jgi:hypothetical protein
MHGQPELFSKMFEVVPRISRGHSRKLRIPSFIPSNETARNHFAWRVLKVWNALPVKVVEAPTLTRFKSSLALVPRELLVNSSKIRY